MNLDAHDQIAPRQIDENDEVRHKMSSPEPKRTKTHASATQLNARANALQQARLLIEARTNARVQSLKAATDALAEARKVDEEIELGDVPRQLVAFATDTLTSVHNQASHDMEFEKAALELLKATLPDEPVGE